VLNIGTGELLLILIVALLVVGPKKLPEIMRGMGGALRAFQAESHRAAEQFKAGFEQAEARAPGPGVMDAPDQHAPGPYDAAAPAGAATSPVLSPPPEAGAYVPADPRPDLADETALADPAVTAAVRLYEDT
jgi:sec-independent protein translocase protein TatA